MDCKILNCSFPYFTDEIQAHTQKVTDLDIGATGRVLVTGKYVLFFNLALEISCVYSLFQKSGGQDRLVNLFVINGQQLGLNAQCSMVSVEIQS